MQENQAPERSACTVRAQAWQKNQGAKKPRGELCFREAEFALTNKLEKLFKVYIWIGRIIFEL